MDIDHDVKSLLITLAEDRKDHRVLLAMLKEQRDLLIARRGQDLIELNHKLTGVYNRLRLNVTKRRDLFNRLNLPANSAGIINIISRLTEQHRQQFKFIWQDLEQKALDCQALNEHNGLLLTMLHEKFTPLLGGEQEYIYHN